MQEPAKHSHFRLKKKQHIEEIKSHLFEYEHIKTHAQIVHLKNPDPENLFVISFPTYPGSSNGVFHILEHTVLCGSQKYPVKDPFFSMLRRSLATFMNAMTGSDFTCYPGSSQIEKDFYQLLEVYLDAVFHPLLKELSFLQEGWRLEFTEPDNPGSSLLYKGVVYNEMKGALSSTDERLHYTLMRHLTPDLPYCHETGGLPEKIPSLSYKELLSAHKKFYHPSHAVFFFYGNLETEKHLQFLQEHCLKNFSQIPPLEKLPKQKRFAKPQNVTAYYPAEEGSKKPKAILAVGSLTCSLQNQTETLALALLEHILFATDASVVCQPLLESGLCLQVNSYLNLEISEVPWLIILKGVEEENRKKALHLLQHTLQKTAAEGIARELIEAAFHQLELARTEIFRHRAPYGLHLFFQAVLAKHHGIGIEQGLQVKELFRLLKEKLKNPAFLPSLIEKYLLSNPHQVTVEMLGDKNLHQKEQQKEEENLEKKQKLLTTAEKRQIIENSRKLQEFQNKKETSLDCLPIFPISDIPRPVADFPLSYKKYPNLNLHSFNTFTNDIIYADLVFDLPATELEELPWLTLFARLLPQIGCKKRTYSENLRYINANLGEFSTSLFLNAHIKDPELMTPTFGLKSKALRRKAGHLFSFLREMAQSADFSDKKRIKELILSQAGALEHHLSSNAMGYAVLEANSNINLYHCLNNRLSGLPYLKFMQKLKNSLTHELDAVLGHLEDLKEKIFSQKEPHLVLTFQEPDSLAEFTSQGSSETSWKKAEEKFSLEHEISRISQIQGRRKNHWKNPCCPLAGKSSAKAIAAAVAFNAYALPAPAYIDPDAAYLTLSAFLMENMYLHPEIREKGGAYGSGVSYHHGSFYFHTFRDPQVQRSLDVFKTAVQKIAEGGFSQDKLEEAVRGAVRGIEEPFSPGMKGIHAFYLAKTGESKKARQEFKDKLLKAGKDKICRAVQKHLLGREGYFCSLAEKRLLKEKLDKSIPIEPIQD